MALTYLPRKKSGAADRLRLGTLRAVKIKVGYPTLKEDIARIKTVRSAVGENIDIMVDANQTLTAAEATVRGRAFEDLGCLWWEEPLPADDIEGYAQLADALDIPIATGENLYTAADFARFFKRNALDLVVIAGLAFIIFERRPSRATDGRR